MWYKVWKPILSLLPALIEWLWKCVIKIPKYKGLWNKFKAWPLEEVVDYVSLAGRWRSDFPVDFISFAKTTAETLKGDCDDWANFWYRLLRKKGYKPVKIHFDLYDGRSHAATIVWDKLRQRWLYFTNMFMFEYNTLADFERSVKQEYVMKIYYYRPIFAI